MDERDNALSLIQFGCKLARQVETNLPYLIEDQPHLLLHPCEEIVKAFNRAMLLLGSNSHIPSSSYAHMFLGESELGAAAGSQDLLGGGYTQPMDLLHAQVTGAGSKVDVTELGLEVPAGSGRRALELELGGTQMGYVRAGDVESFQAMEMEGSDSTIRSPTVGGSSRQRPKIRKGSRETRITRVAAPHTGNTETAPDDGRTWRKYGQKVILNSRFPRSYYRCAHRDSHGCDATKKVQRLDDDPYTYEVTYQGLHTCRTPATPPNATLVMIETTPAPSMTTSIQLGSWYSQEFEVDQKDKNALPESHVQMYTSCTHEGGESSSAPVDSSHVQDANEMECLVGDFAEFMFNSGSSSNSIDAIFSPKQEK